MEPSSRITFNFPIYALDVLPRNRLAVAGGGGLMKSGIPNRCTVLSFHSQSASLCEQASVDLPDAVVALASSGTTLHAVIDTGIKNFYAANSTLTAQSSFTHDLRVSATQRQSAIAVSEDSTTLIVASDEGHVTSVSLPRYEHLFSAHLHDQGVTDLALSRDGSLVATTGRDRAAYLWRSDSGQIVQVLKPVMPPAMRTHVRAIRFCVTQPNIIFTAESNPTKGGWIAAWEKSAHTNATRYAPIASFKASADAITGCAVSSDSSQIAVSSSEGHVTLLRWDGSSFSCLWTTEARTDWISAPRSPHVLPITGVRFSESDEYFFTASADASVAVWPVRRPTNWRRITRLMFWILSLVVGLFAMLMVDDHHLPRTVSYHRGRLQPHLEPHLSRFQGAVGPFFRDRQAQIRPYISEMRHAIEPHLKYAGQRIRPFADKASLHHMRWQSVFKSAYNQLVVNTNFIFSSPRHSKKPRQTGDELEATKMHAKHQEVSEESVLKEDPVLQQAPTESQFTSEVMPFSAPQTSAQPSGIYAGKVPTPSNGPRSGQSWSSDLTVPRESSQSDSEFSNPRAPRDRGKNLSDGETIPPAKKTEKSNRNGEHRDLNESLPPQTERTFAANRRTQKEPVRDVIVLKRIASSSHEIQESKKRLSSRPRFLIVPRTPMNRLQKNGAFTKTTNGQQLQTSLSGKRYHRNERMRARHEHGSYKEPAGAFQKKNSDTRRSSQFALVRHETCSHSCTEHLVPERDSDDDVRTEHVTSDTPEEYDKEEVQAYLEPNRIAAGKEIIYDVNRKISFILRESSYTRTDVRQPDEENLGR